MDPKKELKIGTTLQSRVLTRGKSWSTVHRTVSADHDLEISLIYSTQEEKQMLNFYSRVTLTV